MSRPWFELLGVCLGWIVLTAGCEKIPPSKPFERTPAPTSIQDLPNADIGGTVRDQGGTPLSDVRISLGVGEYARTVRTGGDGSYRLADLGAGAYVVTASKEGYIPGQAQVTLAGEEVTDANIVLHVYEAARGHRAQSVEVGPSGKLAQTTTVRSEVSTEIEEALTIALQLTEGTVLRKPSGRIVTKPVEIRVTPIPGDLLTSPEVGTFGVTEADIQAVPGEPTTAEVDVDLGEGQVLKDVEIVDPNPLLGKGARASLVTPIAGFVLGSQGLTFENPDGTPKPQRVVFGNLPLAGFVSPGTSVELVDREGNVVPGIVGADGRSIQGEVSRLTRYDLLMRVNVEVEEASLVEEGMEGQGELAKVAGGVVVKYHGTTFYFPKLDSKKLAKCLAKSVWSQLEAASCDPKDPKWKKRKWRSRIIITVLCDGYPCFSTYAIIDRMVCEKRFIVHDQGCLDC